MKTFIIVSIAMLVPILMTFLMWLNNKLMERETRLILEGKKEPWIVKNKRRKAHFKKPVKS
jgi:hypothetical protein